MAGRRITKTYQTFAVWLVNRQYPILYHCHGCTRNVGLGKSKLLGLFSEFGTNHFTLKSTYNIFWVKMTSSKCLSIISHITSLRQIFFACHFSLPSHMACCDCDDYSKLHEKKPNCHGTVDKRSIS